MKEQILALADELVATGKDSYYRRDHDKARAALVDALDAADAEIERLKAESLGWCKRTVEQEKESDQLRKGRDWLEEQNQKLTRIHAERTVERDALRKAALE